MRRLTLVGLAVAFTVAACGQQPPSPSTAPSSSPAASSTEPSVAPPPSQTDPATSSPDSPPPPSRATKPQTEARVGDVVFGVVSSKLVDKVSGRADRTQTGHWLAVLVRVTNRSKTSLVINTQAFEVLGGSGKRYQTDDPAMFTDNDSDALIGVDIFPGEAGEGTLLFPVGRNDSDFILTAWKPNSTLGPAKLRLRV